MKPVQFNARLHPDTLAKIKQLATAIGARNTPPNDLSQGDVVTLAVNFLHDQELGRVEKTSEKKKKTT